MFKVIFDKLKEKNINPYAPGKHKGLCDKPFCVILEGSQVSSINTNQVGQQRIDIIVFVPLESYIRLKEYKASIRSAMKELKSIRKTGFETSTITDDDKQAYTMSIEYVIQKKLEG